MICLSETYINHTTIFYDNNLQIPGHELIQADHSSNQKQGGICIHHKDFLPIKVNNISYLKQCLNFNLRVNGRQCNITLIYRSPSQSLEDFQAFLKSSELYSIISWIDTRLQAWLLQILVFAKQCSVIENNSILPSSINPITNQYLWTNWTTNCT